MCGILGYVSKKADVDLEYKIRSALEKMGNRGPDDRGSECFSIDDGRLILGHTRLSIIDLSSGGHQPMAESGGRYFIVFNGEIYNYRELRQELRSYGYTFKSDSDTEVLLNCWVHWGTACIKMLRGMFAFAVYDKTSQTLTCVRDAFGIKPLFYQHVSEGFIFASELPALIEISDRPPSMNLSKAFEYLMYERYDDSSETFFEGINQLLPGHFLTLSIREILGSGKIPGIGGSKTELVRWWSPSIEEFSQISLPQASEELRERFLKNVRLHLRSDVALGAALSGGIDSSALVCAIRLLEPDMPLHTFSFIATGSRVNEERWIDLINKHVDAIPHKISLSPVSLASDLEDLIVTQGEPFGSTSIYAQYKVYQAARSTGIIVTLDGQGADELLAGYSGYPAPRMLSMIEAKEWKSLIEFVTGWASWPGRGLSQGIRTCVGQCLPSSTRTFLTKRFQDSRLDWFDYQVATELGVGIGITVNDDLTTTGYRRRLVEALLNAQRGHGLGALLRHGDRNSMRWSVESRVPFLTHDLAEYLLRLPERFLVSQKGETKHVFREAMRGIVPDIILFRRDKIGFTTPENDWLKSLGNIALGWVDTADEIPFVRSTQLRRWLGRSLAGEEPFTSRHWRVLNLCRWMSLMKVSAS